MNQIISIVSKQIKPTSFNIRTRVHSLILGGEAANRIVAYTRMKNGREKVQLQSKLEKQSKVG